MLLELSLSYQFKLNRIEMKGNCSPILKICRHLFTILSHSGFRCALGSRKMPKSLMKGESSKKPHKNLEKKSDESLKNKRDRGSESDDQSSPRGVFEVPGSGSDSDNSINLRRSMSASASTCSLKFDKKPPAVATTGGCDGDGDRENNSTSVPASPTAETVPWRNMMDNLKWKSFRRFSTGPLVAGYEHSRKSFMKKFGRNNSSEATINEFYMPKPSWRSFTYEELESATNGFSHGNTFFLISS